MSRDRLSCVKWNTELDETALCEFIPHSNNDWLISNVKFIHFVVLHDATVGSWLIGLDAAVQEEWAVGPKTAQQAVDATEAV